MAVRSLTPVLLESLDLVTTIPGCREQGIAQIWPLNLAAPDPRLCVAARRQARPGLRLPVVEPGEDPIVISPLLGLLTQFRQSVRQILGMDIRLRRGSVFDLVL
jgi:hypothetical protein